MKSKTTILSRHREKMNSARKKKRLLRPRSSYISLNKQRLMNKKSRIHNYRLHKENTNENYDYSLNSYLSKTGSKLVQSGNQKRLLQTRIIEKQDVQKSTDQLFVNRSDNNKSALKHFINVLTNHRKSEKYFIEDSNPLQSVKDLASKQNTVTFENTSQSDHSSVVNKKQELLIKIVQMMHPQHYMKPLLGHRKITHE